MITRRQILKAAIGALAWLPLIKIKEEKILGRKVYNPLPTNTTLQRKKVCFPSLFRNGGEVGHESFITEWHIGGKRARITNVKFINTEIYFNNPNGKATIIGCEFNNKERLNSFLSQRIT